MFFRDLKLENILVTKNGHVKIADFGFSVKVVVDEGFEIASEPTSERRNRTICGTPDYMAPELLRCSGSYRALCADIWSL